MLLLKVKIGLILLGGFLNSFWGNTTLQNYAIETPFIENYSLQENSGYTAVACYKSGFIAVGADGRIDHISTNGEITQTEKFPDIHFKCLLAADQFVMAAGDNGNVVISSKNEPFQKIESGTEKGINSIASFNEFIIAVAKNGEILLGDTEGFFQMFQLNVKGNIVSISSNKTDCFGVTDEGEIIHSKDGLNWNIFDFNKTYAGFYKPCRFKKVLVTENNIAVIGIHEDGTPAVLFSNLGNVWTERTLNYTDENGKDGYLTDIPNDILYDAIADEYYIACSNGKMMILPNCSHCNSFTTITDKNLTGISFNGNVLLIVGEQFFIKHLVIR